MSEKLTAKEYAEKLLYTPEYAADKQADVKEKAAAFAEGYKKFMDSAKTERELPLSASRCCWLPATRLLSPKRPTPPARRSTSFRRTRLLWRLPSARSL